MIKATHSGTINLGGAEPTSCHVLEDGQRVLVASQIQGILGASKNGLLRRQLSRLDHGSGDLALLPISFIASPGGEALGYTSEDVVKILRAYQRAFLKGTLHPKQMPIAMAAMAAIEAFADVGLRTLIDDATGYAKTRPLDEQAAYFARVFRERRGAWEKLFDAEWDRLLCRLYGHEYAGRPPRFASAINAMVYRFAFGDEAHAELLNRNPSPSHHSNHHQHLTDEARQALAVTIGIVKGVAKLSRSPREFMSKLGVLYKDAPLQLELVA